MAVSATVISACTINTDTARGLAFGSYDPVSANTSAPLSTHTNISVSCTKGTPYTIRLDGGRYLAGTQRRMVNSRDSLSFLSYNLYSDLAYAVRWGNGTGLGPALIAAAASDASEIRTVYATIPGGQNLDAGNYTDTVIATIEF